MFLGQLGKEVSLRFSECLYNHKVAYPNVTIKGQMPNQMYSHHYSSLVSMESMSAAIQRYSENLEFR
jgi:hypothetical protein